ncbi:loganic acid O-methyltransferase-like [Macadamia integrifolia]|uniref:loganic acid O-methyltransferase-like n=1 Tax=Macadamia integrifolia TaxID=60698 RepID=UPI001C529043|nr:loganic acid O-methyltransferase-like [Macadamia integrifolia]
MDMSYVKERIEEEISRKLDIKHFSSTTETLHIVDLGCSIGPDTYSAVQDIIDVIELKYISEGLIVQIPDFLVFFNDFASNDFNTLFSSFPPNKKYLAAGVPGSFYQRLFAAGFLHFVYSSNSLQWLSKVPEEVEDKNSPAWNKGKVIYSSAQKEVVDAYSTQYREDMESFLCARAEELVLGGMMVLLMPGLSDGTPHSKCSHCMLYDLLGSCLLDMAQMELVNEERVDTFNYPIYIASPKELEELVKKNGCFSIERLEMVTCLIRDVETPGVEVYTKHLRDGMQGPIKEHLGVTSNEDPTDEMHALFYRSLNFHCHSLLTMEDLSEGSGCVALYYCPSNV